MQIFRHIDRPSDACYVCSALLTKFQVEALKIRPRVLQLAVIPSHSQRRVDGHCLYACMQWNPQRICLATTRRRCTRSPPLDSIPISSIHPPTMRKSFFFSQVPSSSSFLSSEEDNDPLTDGGGSAIALPVSLRANRAPNAPHTSKLSRQARHQFASSMLSDDSTGSHTYDGDVEFSITADEGWHQASRGLLYPNLHHASSDSILTSQIEDDAPSPRHPIPTPTTQQVLVPEPPTYKPVPAFNTAALTPEDIQAFVRKAIDGEPGRPYRINPPPADKPVRIYACGKTARDSAL